MGNGKHTGTPAANAASRKTGNRPGSQRGRRVNEKGARRGDMGPYGVGEQTTDPAHCG